MPSCATHELQTEELRVVVGDNSDTGEHEAGYNGIWSLTSVHDPHSLFLPVNCGMNFEFIAPMPHANDPAFSEVGRRQIHAPSRRLN
jgi:hypothetical protein